MINEMADVLAYCSRNVIDAEDILLTGTAARRRELIDPPRYLQPGDVVDAEADGGGMLRNRVIASTLQGSG